MTSASAGHGAARKRGGRLTKWQLVSMLSIDKMHEVWPWAPPQALPAYDYYILIQGCRCANHGHKRKDCPVGDNKRCTICGGIYQDYGSINSYCPSCLEYWEARRDYLAEYAATHVTGVAMQVQLT